MFSVPPIVTNFLKKAQKAFSLAPDIDLSNSDVLSSALKNPQRSSTLSPSSSSSSSSKPSLDRHENITKNSTESNDKKGVYSPFFAKSIRSPFSQYTKGSVSSCTFTSILGCFFLLSGSPIDEELINKILDIGGELHSGIEHVEVSEALLKNKELESICECEEIIQDRATKDTWRRMCSRMKQEKQNSAVIITKAAESFCVCHFVEMKNPWIIFDSHSRRFKDNSDHSGAGFYFFDSEESVIDHLAEVSPFVEGLDDSLQSQTINLCDMVSIKLKEENPVESDSKNQIIPEFPTDNLNQDYNHVFRNEEKTFHSKNSGVKNSSHDKEIQSIQNEDKLIESWRQYFPREMENYIHLNQKINPLQEQLKNEKMKSQQFENFYEVLEKKKKYKSKLLEIRNNNKTLENKIIQEQHQKLDNVDSELEQIKQTLNTTHQIIESDHENRRLIQKSKNSLKQFEEQMNNLKPTSEEFPQEKEQFLHEIEEHIQHIDQLMKAPPDDDMRNNYPSSSKHKHLIQRQIQKVEERKKQKLQKIRNNLKQIQEDVYKWKHLGETECPVCLEDVEFGEIIDPGCEHEICRGCAQEMFNQALHDFNKIPVKCPFPNCPQILEPYLFLHNDDDLGKYEMQAALNSHVAPQNIVYCPRCNGIHDRSSLAEGEKQVQCLECQTLFCVDCLVPWHTNVNDGSNLTCEEYQAIPEDERSPEDQKMIQFMREQGMKRCPKCRIPVFKAQGCNHMTCRCGQRFCYHCGDPFPCTCGNDPHV